MISTGPEAYMLCNMSDFDRLQDFSGENNANSYKNPYLISNSLAYESA